MKKIVLQALFSNANMYLFYKVGSRNEQQGITGLSHFFGHLMINGAKKYGPVTEVRIKEEPKKAF